MEKVIVPVSETFVCTARVCGFSGCSVILAKCCARVSSIQVILGVRFWGGDKEAKAVKERTIAWATLWPKTTIFLTGLYSDTGIIFIYLIFAKNEGKLQGRGEYFLV
jgi:hypothetical protein